MKDKENKDKWNGWARLP